MLTPPAGLRVLTATITTVFVCVATAGCGGSGGQDSASTSTPTPSATSTAPTPTSAAPVAEAALDGLLLSPEEMGAALRATGMAVAATSSSLADDITAPPDAPESQVACVGIAGTAEAQAYAGSGSTAVRDQVMQGVADGGGPLTAGQSVVLFPSAGQAADFVAASAERWPACRRFTWGGSASTVGPVSNTNGILSTTFSRENKDGPASVCERALTATNNVVVEASACGTGPDSAVTIARRVVAKIGGR